MRELFGPGAMEANRKKVTDGIEGVLTAEQKKFEKIKGPMFGGRPSLEQNPEMLMRAVESLKLSNEKEQKIKGIIGDWRAKARKAEDRRAAMADAPEVYKKVMAELTPEEQAKLKEWQPRPMGMMGERGEGRGEGREGRGRQGGGQRGAAKTEK
jgi:hypothetical protein